MIDDNVNIEELLDWCEFNAMDWHRALERLVAERDRLRAELAAAIKQRDEARREVCRYWALRSVAVLGVYRSALDFAADRGWDCYAKEGGGA